MGRSQTAGSLICLGLLVSLPGCNFGPFGGSGRILDSTSTKVWTGAGDRASIHLDHRWDFVRGYTKVTWDVPGTPDVDAREVVRRCEAFEPSPAAPPLFVPNEEGPNYHREHHFADTRTIICVEPVVVLVTPLPHREYSDQAGWIGGDSIAHFKLAWGEIVLDKGFFFGTTLTPAPGAWWFSPDLPAVRTPLAPLPECPARLDVSGGVLVIHDEGERWNVTWEPTPTAATRSAR